MNLGFDKTIVVTARMETGNHVVTKDLKIIQKGSLVGAPVLWADYDYLLWAKGTDDDDPNTIVCLFES